VINVFYRAPKNCIMTSPHIQKDLAKCCPQEITKIILGKIGNRNPCQRQVLREHFRQ
jgi:hypothetical protein